VLSPLLRRVLSSPIHSQPNFSLQVSSAAPPRPTQQRRSAATRIPTRRPLRGRRRLVRRRSVPPIHWPHPGISSSCWLRRRWIGSFWRDKRIFSRICRAEFIRWGVSKFPANSQTFPPPRWRHSTERLSPAVECYGRKRWISKIQWYGRTLYFLPFSPCSE